MSRQLTKKDILNAKEVHFYDNSVLYVAADDGSVYGITEGCLEWFEKENFWEYFESSLMLSYFRPITKEEAVNMYESWKKSKLEREFGYDDGSERFQELCNWQDIKYSFFSY